MSTEKPEDASVRSLAPAVDYVGDHPTLPKIKIPCFGCGRRDVLRYPYAEDAGTMWCTICGTLLNRDENDKIIASIPVLPATILEIYQSSPAIERIQEELKKRETDAATG